MKRLSCQLILVLLGLPLLFQSCTKDSEEQEPCSQEVTLPTFSGITETDETGFGNGTLDNSDWGFDSNWNAAERQLFSGFEEYQLTCENTGTNEVFPAYPNGFNQIFSFSLSKLPSTIIRLRLVRQNGTVLSSVDNNFNTNYSFNLEDALDDTDALLRLYYVFVEEDGCAFHGHGDVMVNQ